MVYDVGVQVIMEKEVQWRRPDRRQGTLQTVRVTSPERFHLQKAPQPSKAVLEDQEVKHMSPREASYNGDVPRHNENSTGHQQRVSTWSTVL